MEKFYIEAEPFHHKRHVPRKTHAHKILILFYIICTEFCRYIELFSAYGQYDNKNIWQCTEQFTWDRGSSHCTDKNTKCIGNTKDDTKDQCPDRVPVSKETDTKCDPSTSADNLCIVHTYITQWIISTCDTT